jgi:hypothetical protein
MYFSLLELDVIAFDSNYNRLDISDTATIVLYNELKRNSELKSNIALQSHLINTSHLATNIKDESFNEANFVRRRF